MDIFVTYIFPVLFIVLCAWQIRCAIIAYRENQLFMCGLFIMFAVYFLIHLVKTVFDI